MEMYDEALEQIAVSVLGTMLDIDAMRGDASTFFSPDSVTSAISIRGGFDGEVQLTFSHELALASAAAMFRVSQDEVTSEDISDMATELANMIGGNLKSVLPGPSSLSLPRIADAAQSMDEQPSECIVLAAEQGPLRVSFQAN
ncbi:MAG: hypothetical protein C0483_07380 [Pirellula sp.]|nr:hypothetical protein [Pirellula sp.]